MRLEDRLGNWGLELGVKKESGECTGKQILTGPPETVGHRGESYKQALPYFSPLAQLGWCCLL